MHLLEENEGSGLKCQSQGNTCGADHDSIDVCSANPLCQDDGLSVDTDDALDDMLGFSLSSMVNQDNANGNDSRIPASVWKEESDFPVESREDRHAADCGIPHLSESAIQDLLENDNAQEKYKSEGVYKFPRECGLSPLLLHRLTEQLRLSPPDSVLFESDKTYETIGGIRSLTRLENFVRSKPIHQENNVISGVSWYEVCHEYAGRQLVSSLYQKPMVLYKEKLNFKPPNGGKGFAPHLDAPSLGLLWDQSREEGPRTFATVMIAIDKMTKQNGCLRVVRGPWSADSHVPLESHNRESGNPDGNGRAGAIPLEEAEALEFEDLECDAGTIVAFNGWVPHRSSVNASQLQRRAIFLTYNPASEGKWRQFYYDQMTRKRKEYQEQHKQRITLDRDQDMNALNTVPT
jgi:hypothetical protein